MINKLLSLYDETLHEYYNEYWKNDDLLQGLSLSEVLLELNNREQSQEEARAYELGVLQGIILATNHLKNS